MKILHLGDLHNGVKDDDPWHEDIVEHAIDQAIAYSKAHGIRQWIQTGDFFDVRKAVSQKTMRFVRTRITSKLREAGITCFVVIGNHDLHYKDRIHPNSVTEILGKDDTYVVIDEPTTVNFEGLDYDLIPWMCKENASDIFEFVKKSDSPWCLGHWELSGFYFYKNIPSSGYSADFLKKYEKVVSGHFHTQSDGGNIHYIGTPYTITAGDEDEPRGFWILDTETRDFEFVPNAKTWHKRLTYPGVTPEEIRSCSGCSVRLIANEVDAGLTKVEFLLSRVVHDLRTINKAVKVEVDSSTDISDDGETIDVQAASISEGPKTIMGLFAETVKNSAIDTDHKDAIIMMANELYAEASTL
ncbi:recombination-related endonuclease [Aeromonas phage SW69-9]|uniref:Exonuclease subunit 1 n=1 Tax=Aeromonas phage vB_AehM_DM2 TaxID=2973716 RepID=A0AA94YNL1_9CAUD|nr:recombination-related endonuclease [Aeromonas phage SW69-9]UYD59606.1 exonuclease subunit 1 [Aeromonas phage avDM5]UYD60420.1 exonuclease subunit 1 [Aeromonas phage avDM2]UYD60744.1 exonuclease subunit 1 [Aeromonas phage avDM2]